MFSSVRIKPGVTIVGSQDTFDLDVPWPSKSNTRQVLQLWGARTRSTSMSPGPVSLTPSGVTIVGSQDTFDLDVSKIQLCSGLVALLNQTHIRWVSTSVIFLLISTFLLAPSMEREYLPSYVTLAVPVSLYLRKPYLM
ncbi:hypothetical protein E2C01_043898 [Portunus trituberculatus]|uniref:Uncharacterized protein n=1 Tax=Portunus trituberculatus TaxID=210409 RepID=A0A5B7FWX1_PORTR|nr:hypothetical protein [Portunus trituberculatus]